MSLSIKKEREQHARECVKLANERFGYRQSLRLILTGFGYEEETIVKVLELARTRQMDKIKQNIK